MMTSRPAIKTFFAIYLVSAVFISVARAELAEPGAGASNVPYSTEEQYCDTVCPSLANSNGQVLGLNGTAGWTTADDQWCANHNAQTNPSILPSPAPVGAVVTQSCSTAMMYPGDTNCAQVTAEVTHCQFHNSQTESYCMAYEGAKIAGGGEKTVLALDIAATAMCATACIMERSASAAIGWEAKACDAAAVGAGAAEILVTLTQKSSALGKIADAALGSVGITEGVLAYRNAGFMKRNNEACLTAITMAALSGVRSISMHSQDSTKQSACQSLWNLQSSNATVGSANVNALAAMATGGSSSSSGGGTVSSSSTNGTAGLNCMSSGGSVSSCTGQQVSGATDGGLLNSGLGNAALPLAQQLQSQGLPQALSGSGGLGGAMGGALSGSGDLGKALTKVAEQAAADGAQLASAAPYSSGGGGGGGSGTASDAASPFAGLLGSGGAAPGSSMQVFRGEGEDTDIWHAHTDRNIFQIVSGRIGKVSPRVGGSF